MVTKCCIPIWQGSESPDSRGCCYNSVHWLLLSESCLIADVNWVDGPECNPHEQMLTSLKSHHCCWHCLLSHWEAGSSMLMKTALSSVLKGESPGQGWGRVVGQHMHACIAIAHAVTVSQIEDFSVNLAPFTSTKFTQRKYLKRKLCIDV